MSDDFPFITLYRGLPAISFNVSKLRFSITYSNNELFTILCHRNKACVRQFRNVSS